jgi:hypothetical protein
MAKASAVALQDRDEERTAAKVSEPPDLILPSQYFSVIRGCGQLTPEQKLMLAVLESAVHDFQRYHWATRSRGQRLFREAQEWLTSREETGVFSCVAICRAVGIDPDYLRKGLSAWSSGKRSGGKAEVVVKPASATDRRREKVGGYDERRHLQYGNS